MTVFAGTGHRPPKLGGYTRNAEYALVDFALWAVQRYKPGTIITGMALGWDMALAEAAWLSHIPYVAHLPFEGQECTWPASSQRLYRNLRSHAVREVIVTPGGYSPSAMLQRNVSMVQAADTILALWNGDTDGGTAHCVRQAEAHKKPIINLWRSWANTYGKSFPPRG